MTGWTTVIAWIGMQWPRSAAVPQRSTRIFALEQSTPPVPRECRALYTYLEHRYASVVVLTLEQIDALLGFALPAPARTERNWWTRYCGYANALRSVDRSGADRSTQFRRRDH